MSAKQLQYVRAATPYDRGQIINAGGQLKTTINVHQEAAQFFRPTRIWCYHYSGRPQYLAFQKQPERSGFGLVPFRTKKPSDRVVDQSTQRLVGLRAEPHRALQHRPRGITSIGRFKFRIARLVGHIREPFRAVTIPRHDVNMPGIHRLAVRWQVGDAPAPRQHIEIMRLQSVSHPIHRKFATSAFTPEQAAALDASVRKLLLRGKLKQAGTADSRRAGECRNRIHQAAFGCRTCANHRMQKYKTLPSCLWFSGDPIARVTASPTQLRTPPSKPAAPNPAAIARLLCTNTATLLSSPTS